MAISTTAIYRNGVLEPIEELNLNEDQQVQVIVVPIEEELGVSDLARLARMQNIADEWLARQPPDAVRAPLPLSSAEKARLDAEFDKLLAELRQGSQGISEAEVAADVAEAIRAVRETDD